jgi:hypothetical protein
MMDEVDGSTEDEADDFNDVDYEDPERWRRHPSWPSRRSDARHQQTLGRYIRTPWEFNQGRCWWLMIESTVCVMNCKCNIEHKRGAWWLPIFILVTGENQDDVHLAIERKTVEDLRSSLRDGRFAEQRSRMILHYGNCNCVYIIEGTCGQTETGVLLSMQFRDRITVIRTSDMETVHIVSKLSSLAEEDRLSLRDRPPEAFAKVNKVPTSDSKCCLAAFLANIPGVSRKMALCIGAHDTDPDICSSCLIQMVWTRWRISSLEVGK